MNSWLGVAEKGSVFGIRFMLFACTVFGRAFARACLRPVILYYVLFHGGARRASRDYLQRVQGKATFRQVYRHLLNFAEVNLDRIFFLQGKIAGLAIGSNGFEHLRQQRATGKGALLVSAHLGSFEAMHVLAGAKDVRVNILTYRGNARMLNSVLGGINPGANARFIELLPGDINAILRIKELIDAGEMVAVMGDRAGIDPNVTTAEFFGAKARFPAGLYILASVLDCPILLTISLYRAPNSYDVYCEPFAEKVSLPRGDRAKALAGYARQYAARLEHFCRLAPGNWFNFYDFWNLDS
jgi:predicted LPLAT superfamily acyltransferase